MQQQESSISGHQNIAETIVVKVRRRSPVTVISLDGSPCFGSDFGEMPVAVIPIDRMGPAEHIAHVPSLLAVVPSTGKAQIQIAVVVEIEERDPAAERFQNRDFPRLASVAIREIHPGLFRDGFKLNHR